MYQSTHASVGQNQGRLPYAQRAGSSPTPGVYCVVSLRSVKSDYASPTGWDGSPPSARRSPRLGISLTEVLIAMGILTVGLLGVASIFPVASFYMQKGDVADRGSAIAQAAFNDAITKGYLDPANWWVMSPTQFESYNMNVDGAGLPQTFSRPVLAAIDECKAKWPSGVYCQRMGGVYAIDPLGVAAMTTYDQFPVAAQAVARPFPANSMLVNLPNAFAESHWLPWFGNASGPNPAVWPVRRATLRQPRTGPSASTDFFMRTRPLDRAAAEQAFSSSDDLAIDVPARADRPSIQLMDISIPDVPLARQSKGDYSWIITAVPSDLRNLAGSNCEVSVVVFYKRPINATVVQDEEGQKAAALDERVTRAKIVSTGLSGGEVLLEAIDSDNDGTTDDDITESPFVNLKKGQWIMLSGPGPNSTVERPQFVARWYRVLAIEDRTETGVLTNSKTQRLVSLRGPQWPWRPESTGNLNNANHLSNNLSAAIIPGAVAVHSKTIRLESKSSWSVQ